MSKNLRITGLTVLIAAYSIGGALAAGIADPQQRARDMIAPSFPSETAKPRGAMGRLFIEPSSYGDPSSQAGSLLKHDQGPAAGSRSGSGGGYADPQDRARSMILGQEG